jgi:hypothetical protein
MSIIHELSILTAGTMQRVFSAGPSEGPRIRGVLADLGHIVICCQQADAVIEAGAGLLSAIVIIRCEGERSLTLVDIMLRARSRPANRCADRYLLGNIISNAT